LDGAQRVIVRADTLAHRLYGSDEAFEEFRCSNELNARYQPLFEESTLRVSGIGERGEARIVELEGARFYVATLFLPQLAAVDRPHPVIDGFMRAAGSRA
jgi:CTP synthase